MYNIIWTGASVLILILAVLMLRYGILKESTFANILAIVSVVLIIFSAFLLYFVNSGQPITVKKVTAPEIVTPEEKFSVILEAKNRMPYPIYFLGYAYSDNNEDAFRIYSATINSNTDISEYPGQAEVVINSMQQFELSIDIEVSSVSELDFYLIFSRDGKRNEWIKIEPSLTITK